MKWVGGRIRTQCKEYPYRIPLHHGLGDDDIPGPPHRHTSVPWRPAGRAAPPGATAATCTAPLPDGAPIPTGTPASSASPSRTKPGPAAVQPSPASAATHIRSRLLNYLPFSSFATAHSARASGGTRGRLAICTRVALAPSLATRLLTSRRSRAERRAAASGDSAAPMANRIHV